MIPTHDPGGLRHGMLTHVDVHIYMYTYEYMYTICYIGIEFHGIYMTYVLGPPSAEVYGSDFRSVPLVAELGERLAAWQTLVLVDGNTK